MSIYYKPSMFNHLVEDTELNSLILFNSYLGKNGIVSVPETKKEKIKEWFSQNTIEEKDVDKDADLKKLKEMGYFVPSDSDEKAKREILLRRMGADNTLRLVIHTSKSCNFRCKYCYLFFEKDNKFHNISKDTQEGIINFVKKKYQSFWSDSC